MNITIKGSVGWKGRNNPEDVQKIHANFDISDEVMEKVAAAG